MKKKTYILEHDDPELWREVRYYAEVEGISIKDKIIELLKGWIGEYNNLIDTVRQFNRKG